MKKDIVLLDGASGTAMWQEAEKRGIDKVPVWKYNIEHPELALQIAKQYVDAGSQIIQTNTFGANGMAVKRSSEYSVHDVVRAGVRIAKEAAQGTGVKVALAAGPLSVLLEPYGDLTEEEAAAQYEEQLGAGMEEQPDLIILETFMDLEMMRVAATVAKRYGVPVFCMMTFEKSGKTMMGNSVQDIIDVLTPVGIDGIGMNCSLGPDLALQVIREFSEKTDLPLVFKPNAGLPVKAENGTMISPYDAETFAKDVAPALELVSYLGCCCGSDADYIRTLKKMYF